MPKKSDLHYWLRSNAQFKGALVLEDGVIEVDSSNKEEGYQKIKDAPDKKVVGTAYCYLKTGKWNGRFIGHQGNTVYINDYSDLETLASDLRKKKVEEYENEEAIRANPEAWLKRELKCHDWYFMFSDDSRAYGKGESHWSLIKSLLKKVPDETARKLFQEHAPKDFQFYI